ncbi:hypothetical protein R9C00_06120 [Flammeovirgaceae bacterium SG7u.111]|nr:hypothetical protein [Flammeovirgaceae bacterium SG7u.132]WPO37017.1 hypothetical protein R9C00_06120 [Flammeovirgaceae bacterium SG7u.111]
MAHIKENLLTIKQVPSLFLMILLMVSCNKKKPDDSVYEYVQIQEEEPTTSLSTLVGEWRLDSVVFITDNIRGETQIPFSKTTWSFTEKGNYTVKIQQNQYNVTVLKDSAEQSSSLTAEIPTQKYKGKYRQSTNELITTILGENTKYQIADQSDTMLHLTSQRIQVPPISKEDEGKLAKHYFTLIQP